MKKKITALLLAAMMLLAVAGCSNTATVADPSTTGAPAGTGTPGSTVVADNSNRVLRIRKTTSLVSTDWEKVTSTADIPVICQTFEGLYGMNESSGGYYQELAKDVKISEDGLTYTITLVDATFQNGDPLKASDVVFSYDRAMANARYNYVTSMLDGIKEIDEKTVEFHLKYPYSAIVHTFFSIKISSEREITEAGESFGTLPHKAGTGPYYISEYDPSSGVKFTAYDGYWRGAPNIKNVEYIIITEDSAAVIAYENGEIDYMTDSPTAEWDALVAASDGHSEMLKGNNIRMVCINYQSPTNNNILGNVLVRKAIAYALNKDNMNAAAANGLGVVTSEYVPSSYAATAPRAAEGGFETYEYNPEKAKELLREAGYTDADMAAGIDIGTLTTYGSATGEKAKAAQVVQSNLADIGIKCEIEVADVAIISPRLHAYDYDICIFGDSNNYDFNNIRQQVHSESSGMDVVRYASENSCLDYKYVEELIDKGVTITDVDARRAIYTELWSIVMDSATIIPYLHMPVGIVWGKDVDPGLLNPTFYHIYDFKWVA